MPRALRPLPLRLSALSLAVASLLPLAACSSEPVKGRVQVTAGDTACTLSTTSVAAGRWSFEVKNTGSKETEFYVYGDGEKVVGEVEHVGPGVTRTADVSLDAGSYTTACKPDGDAQGVRATLTVTEG